MQPGQVRSLGTMAATSGPGVVNAVQPQPVTADPVATAGEVFDGAGDGDGEKAERHRLQDVILSELQRLNAEFAEFEAALMQQYGSAQHGRSDHLADAGRHRRNGQAADTRRYLVTALTLAAHTSVTTTAENMTSA